MILLTRLNHAPFYLNPDLVEQIEATPDTVIRLTTGARFVVEETPEQVVEKILSYRQRIVRSAVHGCDEAVPDGPASAPSPTGGAREDAR